MTPSSPLSIPSVSKLPARSEIRFLEIYCIYIAFYLSRSIEIILFVKELYDSNVVTRAWDVARLRDNREKIYSYFWKHVSRYFIFSFL